MHTREPTIENKIIDLLPYFCRFLAALVLLNYFIITFFDWVYEVFTGVTQLDGWTHGIMVYYYAMISLPIIFVIFLVVVWDRRLNGK